MSLLQCLSSWWWRLNFDTFNENTFSSVFFFWLPVKRWRTIGFLIFSGGGVWRDHWGKCIKVVIFTESKRILKNQNQLILTKTRILKRNIADNIEFSNKYRVLIPVNKVISWLATLNLFCKIYFCRDEQVKVVNKMWFLRILCVLWCRYTLASPPFTSQCHKMVRHTLKILQHLLQDF